MKTWQRRTAGVLTLGGSFLGATLAATFLGGGRPVLANVITSLFIGLYIWGIWCGLKLIEAAPSSAQRASIYWALQIPYFMSPVAGYSFTSGAMLYVSYELQNGWGMSARVGSQFEYSLLQADKPFAIGINFFALAMFVLLGVAAKRRI